MSTILKCFILENIVKKQIIAVEIIGKLFKRALEHTKAFKFTKLFSHLAFLFMENYVKIDRGQVGWEDLIMTDENSC